ncbi:response regulator [Spirosoma arcticum]
MRVSLLLLTSLSSLGALLQAQSFRLPQAQVITDRQGLPQAFVPAILQDKQGFIWAATRDGLARYDGQRFNVFQPDPDGRPSLSFAGLNQIELDRHGRIWIVSERGDIDMFDPRTETFTNFSRQAAFRQLVKSQRTYRLRIDRQDRLWLMPVASGVICWDTKKKQGQWFRHQPEQPGSISSDQVLDVVEGGDGTIWLATAGGLDHFQERARQFTHRRHQPDDSQSLPENFLTRMHRRPNGEIMLFSRRYLTVLQPRTGQLRPYRMPAQGDEWDAPQVTIDRTGAVYFDQNNILFRFTDQEGVQIVTRWNQPNDACSSLLIDRTNVLWVGTAGAGIRTYDLQPNPFQKRRYHRGFYQDLLANDSLGLDLPPVSPAAQTLLSGLSSYNFRSTFDASGRFWFNVGTSDLYRLDRKTGKTDPFPLPIRFRGKLLTDTPCPMTTDSQGRVWAIYGSVAFWFDEQTLQWVRFPNPIPEQLTNPVTELVVDAQALWLATQAGGFWRVDRQNGERRQFVNMPNDAASLSSNSLYCISADPTDVNRLWIGTFGNGLCLFDKRTGQFRRFTRANGLPNNVVYSALPDRYGYLWMGTNKGLCRMNRRTFTTQTFTRDDGIMADEFNRYHYVQFPNGKILMGGLEGFTLFNPRQIGQDAFEPTVELTELQINNEVIRPQLAGPDGANTLTSANRSVLGTSVPGTSVLGALPIQATHQLTLAHNQNYITLQFAALQFNQPTKNRYRYRLEGLEELWKETTRPEASYTNLPPGEYVLALNASNTSGRWSRHMRKLAITIQPPFWATWWAIGLYILMGLSMVWGLLQVFLNRIRLNQTIRLRQQEADQLRAVDTLKTNFFTNISHEFRTPLTLLIGPLTDRIQQFPGDELYPLMYRNATRLQTLINQILDLAKAEAGQLPLSLQPGDLVADVRLWVSSFESLAESRHIRLSLKQNKRSQPALYDPDKLQSILTNLVSNALKFTPGVDAPGRSGGPVDSRPGGQVRVETHYSGEVFTLTVTDSGMGIVPHQLPRIFDRFYQGSDLAGSVLTTEMYNAQQTDQVGTGIGLALVNELVKLLSGTIVVQSVVGTGTTFTLTLPLVPVPAEPVTPAFERNTHRTRLSEGADPAKTPDYEPQATDTDARDSTRPTVLIIEDNDDMRTYIRRVLASRFTLIEATDGQQGLEMALEHMPDLIVTDWMMPRLDGLSLCRALRQDPRTDHTPVVMLTAKAALEDRLGGLEIGADDYLVKPFLATELLIRLQNLLKRQQAMQQHFQRQVGTVAAPPADPSDRTEHNLVQQQFLDRVYGFLTTHLDNPALDADVLASELGMSNRTLHRKLGTLVAMTPGELIRTYRLRQAAQLLRSGLSPTETAYRVGFDNPSSFSRAFRAVYQKTPSDYAQDPDLSKNE